MSPTAIANELRFALLSGRLRPGDELSQVTLADRFGVSRIPVRDALQILRGEGLIEISPNRGARAISLSEAEVREIYELRDLLECDCLRRAMSAIGAAEIEEIDRIRRRSDLEAVTSRWFESDMDFHAAIYRFAGRERQLALIENLRRTCQMFVSAYSEMPSNTSQWLDDHLALVERMRDGDIEAAVNTLRGHIRSAMEHLLANMQTGANKVLSE